MLLRDLKKVYISRPEEINDHGEITKKWKYIGKSLTTKEVNEIMVATLDKIQSKELQESLKRGIAWLNLQQDVNELDRKSSGEVDYSIYKARTQKVYDIQKGDGISITDISNATAITPEYRVIDIIQIGSTYMYRLEKYNGD